MHFSGSDEGRGFDNFWMVAHLLYLLTHCSVHREPAFVVLIIDVTVDLWASIVLNHHCWVVMMRNFVVGYLRLLEAQRVLPLPKNVRHLVMVHLHSMMMLLFLSSATSFLTFVEIVVFSRGEYIRRCQ